MNYTEQIDSLSKLVLHLKNESDVIQAKLVSADSLIGNFQNQLSSFNNSISRKDSLILDLKYDIDELVGIKTTDPKRWFQRPSTWISGAAGVLLGVLISN